MGGVFISAGMPALPLGFPGKGEHGGEPPHSEIKSEYKFKERIFELCNFWMAQQSPWLRTYPVYSLCANSCCQPFYVTERQNEFFARTSFCAQQKCLIHVSRRNVQFPSKMRMHSTEFSYHFFVFSSQQPPSRERSCRGAFMWRMPRKVFCLGSRFHNYRVRVAGRDLEN